MEGAAVLYISHTVLFNSFMIFILILQLFIPITSTVLLLFYTITTQYGNIIRMAIQAVALPKWRLIDSFIDAP